jgi:hypothetical protein
VQVKEFELSSNFCLKIDYISAEWRGFGWDKMIFELGFGSGYIEIVRKLMETSKKIEAGYP